ncbi:hypothetical protein PVAG01_10928 [Phlyctema vagabunda]|uniref:2EXR domain-containing protein n=1 Tax=Phlyctema vagabunda TaxID=108571 RepID=A0ABR4P3N4_9HELO
MEPVQPAKISLTSFECFPALPLELRLKIWRHTFPAFRIVGISHQFASHQFTGWRSPDASPITLQVNQESREETLKHYKLSFGTRLAPATIYFNSKLDSLRFGYGAGKDYLESQKTWLESGSSPYLLNLFIGTHYFPDPKLRMFASNYESLRFMIIDVDEDIYDRKYLCWGEIRHLINLEDLTLIPWNVAQEMEEVLAMFKSTLDKAVQDFPDWTVPDITVVSPYTLQVLGMLKPGSVVERDKL